MSFNFIFICIYFSGFFLNKFHKHDLIQFIKFSKDTMISLILYRCRITAFSIYNFKTCLFQWFFCSFYHFLNIYPRNFVDFVLKNTSSFENILFHFLLYIYIYIDLPHIYSIHSDSISFHDHSSTVIRVPYTYILQY